MDTEHLAEGAAIGILNKGMGPLEQSLTATEIVERGWNLLHEDLSLPAAVLYQDKLRHNLEWMKRFTSAYGMQLAPHGKTSMAPKLFHMQLDAGAWGMTLATAQQTLVAYEHGVRRVLMANELVGKQNMETVARLVQNPEFDFYCLVDSAELLECLGQFFATRGLRLNVLIEIGVDGGRAGVRNAAQLDALLTAMERWKRCIALCGVELYEGVLKEEAEVRAFAQRAVELMRRLSAEKRLGRAPGLLTGAGSAWYDVIAEVFSAAQFGSEVEIVLRPGCYLTHDAGNYRKAQTRVLACNSTAQGMQSDLETALHIWAYVQSVPEPGKAIVGMGRRDVAFDSGLPAPALHFRPGDKDAKPTPAHWQVTKLMDQHAYLQIGSFTEVKVGDMIGFDICHPCLTFDKWRVIPILDACYRVVDIAETFF